GVPRGWWSAAQRSTDCMPPVPDCKAARRRVDGSMRAPGERFRISGHTRRNRACLRGVRGVTLVLGERLRLPIARHRGTEGNAAMRTPTGLVVALVFVAP